MNLKKIKEWRAEEIAKLFLLKSDYKISIDKYPTPLLDLFITLKDSPLIKFAVEIKSKQGFEGSVTKQIEQLKKYREANMLNIPVFIFKIDDVEEKGEFDFLVFPSFKEKRLLIRSDFEFIPLNNNNFSKKIDVVIKWYENYQNIQI